jgi:hypothetical protein
MIPPKRAVAAVRAEPTDLLAVLEARFAKHPGRHVGIGWAEVAARQRALRPRILHHLSDENVDEAG